MIAIKVDHKFSDVTKLVKKFADQIPFATSLAINRTAQLVKGAEEREINDVFDSPTKFTQNSLFIKPSNKQNLTALVKLKDFSFKGSSAAKYLQSEIAGGQRELKPYEKLLRSRGILPSNHYTVPGQGADIDSYGNMSKGQIGQILSYLRANRDVGTTSNSTDKTRARLRKTTKSKSGISYFVMGKESGAQQGIYKVTHFFAGRTIKPVLIFVEAARYDAIFDFKFVAETTIKKKYDDEFKKAFEYAIRTAK